MRSLALAALLLSLPAQAQMYKCVDEGGVTHYSDKPRPGCKGGPVDIRPIPPASGKVTAPSSAVPQQNADFKRRQAERERAEAGEREALGKRCARLRQEQAMLGSGRRLVEIDAKGERSYVDDAARNTRLSQVREELRTCP